MPALQLLPLLAQVETTSGFHIPNDFWLGMLTAVMYAILGLVLAMLGFKLFDWVTPKIDVQHELGEKHNMAVAIVVAAFVLGSFYLVATAIK